MKQKQNNEELIKKEIASRVLASKSLLEFARRSHDNYNVNWHHLEIIKHLEALERGDIDRLIISMPPRHGKSQLSSIFFPVWFLGRNPKKRVAIVSNGRDLASDFGRDTRNLVRSSNFTNVFDAQMSEDSFSVLKWDLAQGGGLLSLGLGGQFVGRGADLLVIDDPHKSGEEADSPTARDSVWSWYQHVAYQRLEAGGRICLTMTRWHNDDLAGRLLEKARNDGWTEINFPAIATNDEKCRKEGEALWPWKYDNDALARIKNTIGSKAWGAQYQQTPLLEESAIFKRNWFRFYDTLPHVYRYIWSWDTASKAKASHDFSVGTFWAECENGYYLVYVWRKKCIYTDLKRAIAEMQEMWEADMILIEDASSGIQLLQDLQETTTLPVLPEKVEGRSKEARASAVSPLFEAGKVFFPRNEEFVNILVDELLSFPAGKRKDQVDSVSQALRFFKRQDETWIEWI